MESITTREAAEILGTEPKDALSFLKAAGVENRSIRSGGQIHQYLWDENAVRELRKILNEKKMGGAS